MRSIEFSIILFQNIGLFIGILLMLSILYIPLFKKLCSNVLDPICLTLVSSIFANVIPILLTILGYISYPIFIYIIICECLFFLGFWNVGRYKFSYGKVYNISITYERGGYDCYLLFSIVTVLSNLITYVKFGIPLFNESRFTTYTDSGGWGILGKISDITNWYIVIYSFYLLYKKQHAVLSYIMLFLVIAFSFLGGAKSFILLILNGFFVFYYIFLGRKYDFWKHKRILFFVAITPIATLFFLKRGSLGELLSNYVWRWVANGDVYWMAFPYNMVDDVTIKHPFVYLFSRILASFRLLPYNLVDNVIGNQLQSIVMPFMEGEAGGPNTRVPVLCWCLFKQSGLILAYLIGLSCSLILKFAAKFKKKGIIGCILFGYVYRSIVYAITDPVYATTFVFNFVILLLSISFICSISKRNNYG